MSLSKQKIFSEALELPPMERAQLIETLVSSFKSPNREAIDKLWAKEVDSRITAYDAGELTSRPLKDVLKDINK